MASDQLAAATAQEAGRLRRLWRSVRLQIVLLLATLAVIEVVLQVFKPVYLQDKFWHNLHYRPDLELGWSPIPNSNTLDATAGFMRVRHNSLGIRDVEIERSAKPTMLFLGDSLVWGYLVEEEARFTNLLRPQLPGYTVLNAGVSGYGTDQEYLWLKRLWDHIEPAVVVLVVCLDNDRADNTHNARYNTFKPYYVMTPDGGEFRGQPVPKSRRLYFEGNWLVENVWLARLAIAAYIEVRHPRVIVPDPTEHLLGMMRDYVVGKGARFLVGLQHHEPQLEAFLQRQQIPYASFDDAERLDDMHWNKRGHVQVADRFRQLFSENGLLNDGAAPAPVGVKP